MSNKNSCQIDNNPVRNKRFRNTFEPLINEANHVDSEPHVEPQIEVIKLDDSCDGSKPVSSRQITNKHITKPPKNEVACPFLRRKRFLFERSELRLPTPPKLPIIRTREESTLICSNPSICSPA